MIRGGANVFAVSVGMWHSDLTMTRRYARIAEADLRQAQDIASPTDRILRRQSR